ncbi:MAG: polysaccharide pyruvyl transferase family protein [Planctomycetota bacterium]|nr:polysaccharide pyruvyl transferase family protein [Planctomycetota bacterium]
MSEPLASAPRLCLFGAAPSTGNLGVSALFHSAVAGMFQHHPNADVTVFDFGRDSHPLDVRIGDATHRVTAMAANPSKRFYRMDTLATMRVLGRLPGLGPVLNPAVKAVKQAKAVWDVSGGDSFTDLYGVKRFWTTMHPKLLTLEQGTPLVLLPQTYGPFKDAGLRAIAEHAVAGASMAWARDEESFATLKDLLGDNFDPEKHRVGVDLAFGLPPTTPAQPIVDSKAIDWLSEEKGAVGINVSGLIYLDPNAAKDQYGFKADYRELIHGLVRGLIERGERVILVPHVLEPKGNIESDPHACEEVLAAMTPAEQEHIFILKPPYTAAEVKSVLAKLKWFCGTRMHSTIGALSSGVPTAAIAYSLKFQGVFETCDQSSAVTNPRSLETEPALQSLLASYEDRGNAHARLSVAWPMVKAKVEEQMLAMLKASGL